MASAVHTSGPNCSGCGRDRSHDPLVLDGEREPCPDCGATAVAYHVLAQETVHMSDSISTSLRPGDQQRDWRRRWTVLQANLSRLGRRRHQQRSGDAIHLAAQEFIDFWIAAYHFKDALIKDQAAPGKIVEDAITNSSKLSLVADLANLDKHRLPGSGHAPRSGAWPQLDFADRSDGDGWVAQVAIDHGSGTIDGTTFSDEVVKEWRALLTQWGLI